MAALVALIRPGGVIVTTATTAQEHSARDVRALSLRSDADQLAALVAKVDAGEPRVDVSAATRCLTSPRFKTKGRPARSAARSSSRPRPEPELDEKTLRHSLLRSRSAASSGNGRHSLVAAKPASSA